MVTSNRNDEAEKYQHQGQEFEEELGKNVYAYQWRDYDPVIARFNKIDRFAEKYGSHSPYAFTINNPLRFIEVRGDSIIGVDEESARRARDVARNSFEGDDLQSIRDLFQLNADGLSFQNITPEDFVDAVDGSGITDSQMVLAWAYYSAINSKSSHNVEVLFRSEGLSYETQQVFGSEYTQGSQIDDKFGGGVNASSPSGSESFSIIIMDSQAPIRDFMSGTQSDYHSGYTSAPGELMAHELLGHALGNAAGSRTARFEDAIQMSNIYWRAQGFDTYYRSGQFHDRSGGRPLSKNIAQGIPKHLAISFGGDKK